jgi:hypothetical protein
MIETDRWALATGYMAATIMVSFVAVAGATAMVRRVRRIV